MVWVVILKQMEHQMVCISLQCRPCLPLLLSSLCFESEAGREGAD